MNCDSIKKTTTTKQNKKIKILEHVEFTIMTLDWAYIHENRRNIKLYNLTVNLCTFAHRGKKPVFIQCNSIVTALDDTPSGGRLRKQSLFLLRDSRAKRNASEGKNRLPRANMKHACPRQVIFALPLRRERLFEVD